MSDLRVDYCGVTYRNPLILASATPGWCGEGMKKAALMGIGGVVPKTLGPIGDWVDHPRNGRMKVYRVNGTPVGMMDLELFTTKSKDEWIDRDLALAKEGGAVMHISILAMPDPDDTAKFAREIEETGMADLLEINVSCPMPADSVGMHIGKNPELVYRQVKAVKSVSNIPVTIKLTPMVTDIVEIAQAAKDAGADGISIGNSLRGFAGVDIDTGRPYQRAFCGYGGPAVKPVIMAMIAEVASRIDIPISAIGGVSSYRDVVEYIMCGATTVQLATAVLWNGYEIIARIVSDLEDWMNRKGYRSFDEIRGMALPYITTTEKLAKEPFQTAWIDSDRCVNCGRCQKVCMYEAISKEKNRYEINKAKCDGCGLCTQFCPKEAVGLQ